MNLLEQVLPKTCEKQPDVCSNMCSFYKICVSDLVKTDKVTFFDYYIKYHNNENLDNRTNKRINEYKQANYSNNENLFFEDLIEYFKKSFLNLEQSIPDTIIELLQKNDNFSSFVSNYVKINNPELINNSSISYFEELSFLLYLSGMDKDYDISEDIVFHTVLLTNESSTSSIIGLMNYYYDICSDLYKTGKYTDFKKNIPLVVNLFDIINNAILIGDMLFGEDISISVFLFRIKQKIEKFIEMSSVIDNNEEILNSLKYSYFKIDLVFSHLVVREEIHNSSQKNEDILLSKYNNSFKQQISAYHDLKKINYTEELNKSYNIYKVFLGNISVSLLDLLELLEESSEKELLGNPKFIEILDLYKRELKTEDFVFDNLTDLKKDLINNMAGIYSSDLNDIQNIDFSKMGSEEIIRDFIESDEIDQYKIEALYYLVRCGNINKNILIDLGKYLIVSNFTSYYHEDFKIKILGLVVKSFVGEKNSEFEYFLDTLQKYIIENKIATHLINSYSHIYLYMSLYYSCLMEDYNTKDITKLFYYKFIKMRTFNSLNENQIIKLTEVIAYNIGYSLLNTSGVLGKLNREDIIMIGRKYLREAESEYYNEIKNEINLKITNLINDNLVSKISELDILKEILHILSSDLFHGFCDISIVDISESTDKNLKKGYDKKSVHLYNGYYLSFVYPVVYKHTFQKIYDNQGNYVIDNVKNIIITNIQKRELEYDRLTGFLNEASFFSKLNTISKDNHSIILVKIVNIGDVNKGYSNELGDKYLSEFALGLKKTFSGIIKEFYRGNGANFIIDLKDGINEEEVNIAFSNFEETKIMIDGLNFPINYRFGAILDYSGNDIYKKLMSAIDIARTHNEKSCFYHESLIDEGAYKKNIEVLHKVQEAIKEDRIVPYFQSIHNLKDGTAAKYEALVRILNKDGSFISPIEFIPVLAKLGKLQEITNIMIDKTFKAVSEKGFSVSINITGDDFRSKHFIAFIDSKLEEYSIEASKITFEVLESYLNIDIKHRLRKLKDRGFEIAMDDLGDDNSNINRFNDLTKSGLLDYVKLDGTIVKPLIDGQGFNTVKGIIEDCHKDGVKVIAEYVENDAILNMLKVMGVDFGQGYHYAKPKPLDEI